MIGKFKPLGLGEIHAAGDMTDRVDCLPAARQERGGWALVDVLRQPVFGRLVECEDEWCQVSDDALAVTKLI
jgi:hypothetical protein